MKLHLENFTGEYPIVYKSLIQDNFASQSTNCDTSNGTLKAFRTHKLIKSLKKNTQFCIWDEQELKEFADYNISYARIKNILNIKILTGLPNKDYPCVCYDEGIEQTFYKLGIPTPTSAPSSSSLPDLNFGLGGGSLTTLPQDGISYGLDSRSYVYTYVNEYGEEGSPSPSSASVKVKDGSSINVSGLKSPSRLYNIKFIRVYRCSSGHINISNSSAKNGVFRLVKQISASTSSVSDNVKSVNLGDTLDSRDVCEPPDDLNNVVAINNSIFAGISQERKIRFSSPNQSFNWNIKYEVILPDKILRLFPFNNYLIAFTSQGNYCINTNFSENGDVLVNKFNDDLILVNHKNKYSIVKTSIGIAWISNYGIVITNNTNQQIVTLNFFDYKNWQKLLPNIMTISNFKGFLFFSSPKMHYMLPIMGSITNNQKQVFLTEIIFKPDYMVSTDDTMLFIKNNDVYQFNSGNHLENYCWKSKKFIFDYEINFAVCKINLGPQEGRIQFELIGNNDIIIYCQNVVDNVKFRLPSARKDNIFYIRITGTKEVHSITLATSYKELIN